MLQTEEVKITHPAASVCVCVLLCSLDRHKQVEDRGGGCSCSDWFLLSAFSPTWPPGHLHPSDSDDRRRRRHVLREETADGAGRARFQHTHRIQSDQTSCCLIPSLIGCLPTAPRGLIGCRGCSLSCHTALSLSLFL